ncbi:putative B3 domain-containing protein [Salvia divinorum]|uniref:B3 domain-containing protein n=1 Tax=Salvia divinorum TaxID=28513 RepID=A0ABD1I3F2_SALDI
MARRGRRRSFASVEGAVFFKVYLPNLSSHQLLIPPDFTKGFRRALSEKVILKNNDGKTWSVEVRETPSGIFLKDGWQSFVEYHGLKVGEFLVFCYRGSYSFLVKIFGVNGCKKEILGPNNIATRVKSEEDTDEETKPDRACRKRASPQGKDHLSSVGGRRSKVSRRFREVNKVEEQVGASEQPDNSNESKNTVQVVPKRSSFVSPPSRSRMLRIPDEVTNDESVHLEAEMNLRNARGKEWPVKIYTMHNGPSFLGKGLYAFQTDNNIGPKDSCKFTFGTQTTIDVKILRKSKKSARS